MLTKLRNGKDSWFIKIFLGLTALGLLGWNLPQIISSINSSHYALKSGKTEITAEDVQIILSQTALQIAQQKGLKRPLTPTEIQKINLPTYVYNMLASQLPFSEAARNYGLVLSPETFVNYIKHIPFFQNQNESFDRQIFEHFLHLINSTSNQYFHAMKSQILSQQLLLPLINEIHPPKILNNVYASYLNQQHNFTYIMLLPESYEKINTPSDKILRSWFEKTPKLFLTPEIRQISYFTQKKEDQKLFNEITKAKTDGATIKDLAQQFKIKEHTIQISEQETDFSNIHITLPQKDTLITKIFLTPQEDLYIPQYITSDDEIIWFQLEQIIEPVPQTFEQAKSKIIVAWKKEQTDKNFFDKLQKLKKELNNDTDYFDKISKKLQITPKTLNNATRIQLTRLSNTTPLPQTMLSELFSLKVGENRLIITPDQEKAFIIKLNSIKDQKNIEPTEEQKQDLIRSLQTSIHHSLWQYFNKHYPVLQNNEILSKFFVNE